MPVYLVANITIDDREEYGRYEAGFLEAFATSGGTLLAVDEAQRTIEGEWPHTRTVIIEFPDDRSVREFYDSDEYRSIVRHRHAASRSHIAIVSGLG
jgi:uncharacterized protein (DUF1330 family)